MDLDNFDQSNKKYLLTLYRYLEIGITRVSTREISYALGISQSTAVTKLKQIALTENNESSLITYQKYYGVKLTPTGIFYAAFQMRKYRIMENILLQLGLSWKDIYLTMNDLVIPQSVYDQLELKLPTDFLVKCPHGLVIPNLDHLDVIKPSYPINIIPDGRYIGSFSVLEQPLLIDKNEIDIWKFENIVQKLFKIQESCKLKITDDQDIILMTSHDELLVPKNCLSFINVYSIGKKINEEGKIPTIKIYPDNYEIQKSQKIEKLIDTSHKSLKDVISQDSDKIGLFTFNNNLEFTSWNANMTKIFNLDKSSVIGKSLLDFIPQIISTDEIGSIISVFKGQPASIDKKIYNSKIYNISFYPLKNMAGDITGGTTIIQEPY